MEATELERKVTLTVPRIHTKNHSTKYRGRLVTRGYYLNVPQKIVEQLGMKRGELVELTIKKVAWQTAEDKANPKILNDEGTEDSPLESITSLLHSIQVPVLGEITSQRSNTEYRVSWRYKTGVIDTLPDRDESDEREDAEERGRDEDEDED